eukprot:1175332-Prorocentrum_minimum.AAC.3
MSSQIVQGFRDPASSALAGLPAKVGPTRYAGESAANTVRCALGQFELCMDQSVPTNLVIFRFVSKVRCQAM